MKDLKLSSQGTWITVNNRYVFKVEGYVSPDDEPVPVEERKEVARRIVACVNACEGLPDAGLQPGILMRQAVHEQELIAQRDELLEELSLTLGSLKEICAERQIPRPESTIRRAELAIARAKGVPFTEMGGVCRCNACGFTWLEGEHSGQHPCKGGAA